MGLQTTWNDPRRRLTLRLADGSRMLPPFKRQIEARIAGEKTTRTVLFNGKRLILDFDLVYFVVNPFLVLLTMS
jgi:hypothetical protein